MKMSMKIFFVILIFGRLDLCENYVESSYADGDGNYIKIKTDNGTIDLTCEKDEKNEKIFDLLPEVFNKTNFVDDCEFRIFDCPFPTHFSAIARHLPKLKIVFIETEIDEITSEAFDEILSASSLNLRNSDVKKLDERAFANFRELKSLNIDGSKLESLPENVFDSNSKLTNFEMNHNAADLKLKGKIFANKSRLQKIVFINCNVKQLSDDIFMNSKNIRNINFRDNKLEVISM